MALADVLGDVDFDFDAELGDDTTTTASDGPLTGSRSGRGGSASGTTRKPRRASKSKLDGLKAKLTEQMFMAGAMGGMALPVTGIYVCQESERFCGAVVDLAATNPRWIEALEKLTLIEPGLIVGRTAFGIGGALAVDRGRAQPDTAVMKFLGVYQASERYKRGGMDASEEGSSYTPPPAAFAPLA